MKAHHMAIVGGLLAGAVVAIIVTIDRNRVVLDKAIDNFSAVELTDIFVPTVGGVVTEGDPDDFTVTGTFGGPTRGQQIRNRSKQI